MFKKYLEELINAKTDEEVNSIFYREDGIDQAFQNEKLTAKELTILTDLTNKLSKLMRG